MDRNIFIAGGSRGICFCTAKVFIKHGDKVIIIGHNAEKLKQR